VLANLIAAVEDVEAIPGQVQRLDECIDRDGKVVEGVTVVPLRRHLGKAKARQVWRNHPEVGRQQRYQVAKHM
jgi:hypothetical protein